MSMIKSNYQIEGNDLHPISNLLMEANAVNAAAAAVAATSASNNLMMKQTPLPPSAAYHHHHHHHSNAVAVGGVLNPAASSSSLTPILVATGNLQQNGVVNRNVISNGMHIGK